MDEEDSDDEDEDTVQSLFEKFDPVVLPEKEVVDDESEDADELEADCRASSSAKVLIMKASTSAPSTCWRSVMRGIVQFNESLLKDSSSKIVACTQRARYRKCMQLPSIVVSVTPALVDAHKRSQSYNIDINLSEWHLLPVATSLHIRVLT
ncbi:hypothetical protein BDQ17DRAFT_1426904 [Cyathus striatus]|nr:hypothetical protein BDQ17DRAFT_1426904 [Cyathus striatus]